MKVVILAGGFGTRLSEETEIKRFNYFERCSQINILYINYTIYTKLLYVWQINVSWDYNEIIIQLIL